MNNKKELINFSVLMSIYSKETVKNLNQCLESLAVQTLPATEIIIVKDGLLSKELEKCLLSWQERIPLKIIGYEENKGLAYALNYGLQFCSYELLARMDSDDICMPNRFEKQIKYFMEHKETVIIGSNIIEFYDGNQTYDIGEKHYPVSVDKKSTILFKGIPIAHPTVIIKTEILKKYKYNTNVYSNEDVDLWFRLILDGYKIENINEPLLRYRFTEKTFIRRNYKKIFNELKMCCYYLCKIYGFSLLLVFPLSRFIIRLLPVKIIKMIYFSKARQNLFSN